MSHMSKIELQQLPSTLLKRAIYSLELKDKYVCLSLNRYFRQLTVPILYKYGLLEVDQPSKLKLVNPTDRIIKLLAIHDKVNPLAQKYNTFVYGTVLVCDTNTAAESVSCKKKRKLNVNEKVSFQVDSNVLDTTTNTSNLNSCNIIVDIKENCYIEPLLRLVYRLKKVELNYFCFDPTLANPSNLVQQICLLESLSLVCLKISIESMTTRFFVNLNTVLPNLRSLEISTQYIVDDPDLHLSCYQPIRKIQVFKCDITNMQRNHFSTFILHPNTWPDLKEIEIVKTRCSSRLFPLHQPWSQISKLECNSVATRESIQIAGFYSLKNLKVKFEFTGLSRYVKQLFTNLKKLSHLSLEGIFTGLEFNFKPNMNLQSFSVIGLKTVNEPLLLFLSELDTCTNFTLFCNINQTTVDDLNHIQNENICFPNLISISFKRPANQLINWFQSRAPSLYMVQLYNWEDEERDITIYNY